MRTLIVVLALLGILAISGCSESGSDSVTGAAVSEVQTQQKAQMQPSCVDECNADSCDGWKLVKCELQADGCSDKVEVGLTKDKCGVVCLSKEDCSFGKQCNVDYQCEEIKTCHSTWKCVNESTSAYQNSDCTLSSIKKCENLCGSDGKCNPKQICTPKERKCDGNVLRECNSEGTTWKEVKTCDVCEKSNCVSYGQTSSFSDSLQELKDKLEDTSRINKKINDCAVICAGEDANIPAIKNEFYSACYQIYYYTGEEELDKFVADCRS